MKPIPLSLVSRLVCVATCVLMLVYLLGGVKSESLFEEEYFMESYVGGTSQTKFNNIPSNLYPVTPYSTSINVRGLGKEREISFADYSFGAVVRLNETDSMVTSYFGKVSGTTRFTNLCRLDQVNLNPKYLFTFDNEIYFLLNYPGMIGKINSDNLVEVILGSAAVACVDGAVAKDCELTSMAGLEVVSDRIYILDSCRIWYIDKSNGKIFKFTGMDSCGNTDGPLLSAKFYSPTHITAVNGSLYVVQASCVRVVTDNTVSTFVGNCQSQSDVSTTISGSRFLGISGFAYHQIMNAFVVLDGSKIKLITSTHVSVYAGSSEGSFLDGEDISTAKFKFLYALKVDNYTGDLYFFSNYRLNRISKNKVNYVLGSGYPGYNETGFDRKYADVYYNNVDTKFDGTYMYYAHSYGVKKVNYNTGIIYNVAGCNGLNTCNSYSSSSDFLSFANPISAIAVNKFRNEVYLSQGDQKCLVWKVLNRKVEAVGGIGCVREGGTMLNATLAIFNTPQAAVYDPTSDSVFVLQSTTTSTKVKKIQYGNVTDVYSSAVSGNSYKRLKILPDGKVAIQETNSGLVTIIHSNKTTTDLTTLQPMAVDFFKTDTMLFTLERFCQISYGTTLATKVSKLLGVLFTGWNACNTMHGRIENGITYLYIYGPTLKKVGKFRVDTLSVNVYVNVEIVAEDPTSTWKDFVLVGDSFYFIKEGLSGVYKYDNSSNPVITTIACPDTSTDEALDGSFEECRMQSPNSISLNPNGDLLVTDDNEHNVKLISFASKTVQRIGGGRGDGGLFSNAYITSNGFMMRNNGDLLLADKSNYVIRKVDASTNIISTFMGTGKKKHSGDGGLAIRASFNTPSSIFEDARGNFYVTDSGAHVVRKIFSNGTIVRVAGTINTQGYSGDGGDALDAQLKNPTDVSVNSLGEIFIADNGNNVIRKVLTNGTIITFAGNATMSATLATHSLTPATQSAMQNPIKIALKDDKSLFVVDSKKRVALVKTLSACPDGKSGVQCEEFECNGKQNNDPSVCSSNGLCVDVNSCSCYNGWSGSNCEITMCYSVEAGNPNVCNGKGKCSSNNTCVCDNGWEGIECKTPICFGYSSTNSSVCNGKGTCNSKDKCTCLEGWESQDCSTPLCFSKSANNSNVCSGQGQCVSNNTCICKNGWKGDSCSIASCQSILQNDVRVCSGRGSCVSIDTCECVDGWVGSNCEQFTCFGLLPNDTSVCNFRNGSCISNNTCSCEKEWKGKQCDISTCFGVSANDASVCGGNGICKKMDSCECITGWMGPNCTIPNCYGLSSSNPLVCSSHGECISNNTCLCKDSWFGNACHATHCYGEESTSRSVCASHGSCIGFDNCKCEDGWRGSNCSEPICFNVPSSASGVCSSHGKCVSNNTCTCEYGWYKSDCSVYSCFGILSTENNLTCSGHGECQSVDNCKCESKWKGETCSLHTCFGIVYNETNVCSGNGSCVGVDNCVCSSGWSGTDCSIHSCAAIPANYPTSCSGHGSCTTMDNCTCEEGYLGKWCELYYCFGKLVNISTICKEKKPCSPLTNCSNHGDCDIYGECQCHSNSSFGFWRNSTCNECKENYHGSECKTFFEAPARFTNDFSGVSFKLVGGLIKDQTIECSRIITPNEMFLFGSKPKCNWIQATSTFNIIFSNDYQLTPNKSIHLNMLVFDSVSSGGSDLISTTVLGPLNPVLPTAQISQTRSEYGSCEEIIIDGSSSFSADQKQLQFFWKIFNGVSVISETISNSSFFTIPPSAPHGDYSVNLMVKSSLSGLESQSCIVSFKKQKVSFPVISIVGGSTISTVVTQVPAVVSTIITLPECISNSSNSLSYKWEKIKGPELSMISNSKDLIITEFNDKSSQSYTFKITITPLDNLDLVTSAFVYLNTTLEPFNTILYVSELTTEKAIVGADFSSNLDLSLETFKWTCEDSSSKAPCETSINTSLNQFSVSKTTTISIPATKQNITIILQVRDVIERIDIVFPTSKQVAPLINLLSITPSGISTLRSKEILNLQLSVSINGVEEGIDSILNRVWTLNGQPIPDSYVSNMKSILSDSNYIILDISKLAQGADYILQFTATNIECSLSSSYSFKFNVAQSVPKCTPTSSIQEGYALESKFLFSLPNCKLSTNLEAKYYFVDEKSGASIFLASGEQISTLLPLSSTGSLTISLVIREKTTGETSETSMPVKVLTPTGRSVKDIKLKQKIWEAQASKLLPGDPQTNVLNSGNIAQIVQTMLANINMARMIVSNCQNGNVDPKTQECICNVGFSKMDCSITTDEWLERKELMDSLALMFSNSFNNRNKYEKVTESYLLSQIYSMRNILKSVDELSYESIELLQNILGELSVNSNNNKNLQSPTGIESLLSQVINSLYMYRRYILKEKLTSEHMNNLMNVTLDMTNALARNKYIGGDSFNFKSDLIEITTSKIYPRDLSQFIIGQSNSSIKLPNGMMKYLESSYSKRKPLTLRLTNTINFIESAIDQYYITSLTDLLTFEVLEYPLLNISERIDFSMNTIPSSRSVTTPEVVCAMLLDGHWDRSKCLLSRSNTSNMVDCLCTQQGIVSALSLSKKEQTPVSSSAWNPSTSTTNPTTSKLELLAILSLLVLVLVCACLVGCISYFVIRKKKQNNSTPWKGKEMASV